MIVGPSKRRRDWASFFAARHWQPEEFARLVEGDEIGSAFFEIETQI
ncbi:MAG TPA: SIR2 family protein, partial [Candidatus Accumulibacter sp.]|nr:SIR2 family protein [Accumulibacter sp.]